MNDFEYFSSLLIKRLFWPLKSIILKIHQLIPLSIKKHFTFSNLETFSFFFFLLCFLTNYIYPKNEITKIKLKTAQWPLSITNHLQLSKIFFQTGHLSQAEEEINQAQKLYQLFKFFDFNEKLEKKINKGINLVNQPKKINQQIKVWQKILKTKPNFRNAYWNLSLLYYQKWENEKALTAWKKSFYLDPNNKITQKIRREIN